MALGSIADYEDPLTPMPFSPKRACSVPRCPHFTPCPLHNRRGWKGLTADRYERGYGRAWQQLRAWVLQRDAHVCQAIVLRGVCAMPACPVRDRPHLHLCHAPATHVDHVLPKSRGGLNHPDNLISLCAHHHQSKTGREGKAAQSSRD
jgi:5-methylcytosine-specific restriction protein A